MSLDAELEREAYNWPPWAGVDKHRPARKTTPVPVMYVAACSQFSACTSSQHSQPQMSKQEFLPMPVLHLSMLHSTFLLLVMFHVSTLYQSSQFTYLRDQGPCLSYSMYLDQSAVFQYLVNLKEILFPIPLWDFYFTEIRGLVFADWKWKH